MNGSSPIGHCSNHRSGSIPVCEAATSSVLFDGFLPILNFNTSTWASQLVVLSSSADLIVGFLTDTVLSKVEVVMFNCPKWGIAVQSITFSVPGGNGLAASTTAANITSCDDLVTVSLQVPSMQYSHIQLNFDLLTDSQSVSIAEVRFYKDGACLQDAPTKSKSAV